jgi:mRNA interferase RelE/StbE
MYSIELKPRAQRFIKDQTGKIQAQIIKRIETLRNDPHPQNSRLLHTTQKLYRLTCGDYRIIYQVDDGKLLITIATIGNRKDVYRQI